MSLYYVTVERVEGEVLACAINVLDTRNISQVPVRATFALGLLLDLWDMLRKGLVRLIAPPMEAPLAKERARQAAYALNWEELAGFYFGIKQSVTASEYALAYQTWTFGGRELIGASEGEVNGNPVYTVTIAPDEEAFRARVSEYIANVQFAPLKRSPKRGTLTITMHDAAMLDFLAPGLAWESRAAW